MSGAVGARGVHGPVRDSFIGLAGGPRVGLHPRHDRRPIARGERACRLSWRWRPSRMLADVEAALVLLATLVEPAELRRVLRRSPALRVLADGCWPMADRTVQSRCSGCPGGGGRARQRSPDGLVQAQAPPPRRRWLPADLAPAPYWRCSCSQQTQPARMREAWPVRCGLRPAPGLGDRDVAPPSPRLASLRRRRLSYHQGRACGSIVPWRRPPSQDHRRRPVRTAHMRPRCSADALADGGDHLIGRTSWRCGASAAASMSDWRSLSIRLKPRRMLSLEFTSAGWRGMVGNR